MPTATLPTDEGAGQVFCASVVMPIRKCRATVARSLDALTHQKVLDPCEIIFICDKPNDDFLDVICNRPLVKQWLNIEIFHPGRSLAQAYNPGWRVACAKLVFNLHSDCYPAKNDVMNHQAEWLA